MSGLQCWAVAAEAATAAGGGGGGGGGGRVPTRWRRSAISGQIANLARCMMHASADGSSICTVCTSVDSSGTKRSYEHRDTRIRRGRSRMGKQEACGS